MKRYIKIVFCMIIVSVSASCSLDFNPKSSLTAGSYWKSETDVEGSVTAMYYSLSKSLSKGYYDWGELRGGNWTGNQPNGPDQYDIITNNIKSTNSAALWTNLYQTINRANLIIKYAPSVSMMPSAKCGYLAESYAIRALAYFYVVRVWGDAPLSLEPVEEYLVETVFKERTSSDVLLNQIVSDLEAAEMYAQPITGKTFSRSRVNIMAIYAMMADVYAWMHDYGKVIEVVEKINSLIKSKPYWKLLTLSSGASQATFSTQWRAIFSKFDRNQTFDKLNEERIFYLSYNELENGTNGNTSYFCTGVAKAMPSEQLLSLYEPDDYRYAATYSTGSTKRLTLKFWPDNATFGSGGVVSDSDLILYRMSDIVLLHAEALAASGQLEMAVAELNKIRVRAGLGEYTTQQFLTPDELISAILKERTIELIGEGKYWFDLLRTGHAGDIGGVDDPNKYLFPISKTHLDENDKLRQNDGYGTE